jgi:hypothetical protein
MKLPTPQAAQALGYSVDFLRDRCKDGVFVKGEHWFYRSEAKNAPRIFNIELCSQALQERGYLLKGVAL